MRANCVRACASAHRASLHLYFKQVPGQIVLGVIVLCIALLLCQHAALRRAQVHAGSD